MRTLGLVLSFALALAGCAKLPWDDPSLLASARIGPEGGRIEAGDVALDIPAGALGETTEIRIRASEESPEGISLLSSVYRFEPAGLTFSQPVQLTHELPDASSGVLLWTRRDDAERFEFAAFVRDGRGVAEVTHFSAGAGAEERTACAQHAESECAHDGCDVEPSPPPPDATMCRRGPSDSVLPIEPCRRLCHCQAPDIGDNLCAVDPAQDGDREYAPRPCPAENADVGTILANGFVERAADGREQLGRRNGESCSGYALRPILRHLCGCVLETGGPSPETIPLCRRPWIDPSGTPECLTTRDGRVPEDALEDFATRGWTREDDSEPCLGHYVEGGENRGPVRGRLACDLTPTAVGSEWVPLDGTTHLCQLFGWPGGMAGAAGADIDRAQCRLTDEQWARLTERRDQCGIPQRLSPQEERQNPGTTRRTLSILDVDGETGPAGITGLSTNGRELAGMAGAMCRAQPDQAALYEYDLASQGSKGHAEGEALLQLALQRMAPQPDGLSSEAGVGTATMIVDRDPCAQSCARCGIDSARRVAGVSELTLHSPSGTIVYRDDYPVCGLRLE